MKPSWSISDLFNSKYLDIIEFLSNNNKYHYFEIIKTPDRLVFGYSSNCGFIEYGYMIIDNDFSIDENLNSLIIDLESYYNNEETFFIVYNDRM